MIQMTTDGKCKVLQIEGIDEAFNRIERELCKNLKDLALQAFDIGYEEGYKIAAEFNAVKEESKPLTFEDIKIGDELRSIPSSPMYESTVIVVTYNCGNRIYGFRKNTGAHIQLGQTDLSGWRKTGKTYPEIAKLIGGRDA